MLDWLIEIDTKLFIWLNSFHNDFCDKIMWFISGKKEWLPLYALIIGYIIYKCRWRSIWIFLSVGLLITLADTISTQILKENIERLRPSRNPEISEFVHIVNGYRGGKYGFVSSHAANSMALATFLALVLKNRFFTIFIITWAILVSYSRIYLGVHYPGDIIGGILLGLVLAYTIFNLYKYSIYKIYKDKI